MNFNGLWINKQTGERIKLSGPNGSDDYLLESGHDGNDFQITETISIYHSEDNHALLAHSDKFGRRDILKINPDRFQIGDEIFERYDQKGNQKRATTMGIKHRADSGFRESLLLRFMFSFGGQEIAPKYPAFHTRDRCGALKKIKYERKTKF